VAEPSPAPRVPVNRAILEGREGVVVIGGSIERADVVSLCARARPLFADLAEHGAEPLVCEVGTLRAEHAAVDVLAHLARTAHRLEGRVRLHGVPPALQELLALAGLVDVVPCEP
jgi:ABC-type transporter Mla MlaB component